MDVSGYAPAMPKGTKILFTVLAISVVVGGLIIFAAVRWFDAATENLEHDREIVSARAEAFGAVNDQQGCVDESKAVIADCSAFNPMCQGRAGYFMRRCLEFARVVPGFCDDVPSESSLFESAKWSAGRCATSDSKCKTIAVGIQKFCEQGQ